MEYLKVNPNQKWYIWTNENKWMKTTQIWQTCDQIEQNKQNKHRDEMKVKRSKTKGNEKRLCFDHWGSCW